jgi:hypothetical protein
VIAALTREPRGAAPQAVCHGRAVKRLTPEQQQQQQAAQLHALQLALLAAAAATAGEAMRLLLVRWLRQSRVSLLLVAV